MILVLVVIKLLSYLKFYNFPHIIGVINYSFLIANINKINL